MKKLLSLLIISLGFFFSGANAEVVGVVDFDKVVENYTKVKVWSDEMSDKVTEIQRYTLDKEREYKKLATPLERKNFEEATAREIQKKQAAYMKLKEKRETDIDNAIRSAVKQAAVENKVDTVVDKSVVFFGGVDLTDKVVKILNSGK